ncbi:MAG TPA: hypothetical protein VJB37_02640 [Patescibacteria group bacterium]|nr:hypothetical protein [Patescibacteria group bacterium]
MHEDKPENSQPPSPEELRKFAEEKSQEELQRIDTEKKRLEAQYEERQLDVAVKAERLQEKIKEKEMELERVREELEKLKEELTQKQEKTLQRVFNLLEIRALREKIGAQSLKAGELQREFDGLWVLYDDLQKEARSKVEINEAEKLIRQFYGEQAEKLEAYEKDRQARDVSNVSRNHDAVLTHSFLSFNGPGQVSVMKRGVKWKEMLHAVLAFDPNLSTASVRLKNSPDRKPDQSFFSFGVLLKGGEIRSASPGDAGTRVTGGERYSGANSSEIKEEIDQAIGKETIGHNEIVVRNPQVGALFFDSDVLSRLSSGLTEFGNDQLMDQIVEEGRNLGMPVYVRDVQTGNYYLVEDIAEETEINGWTEIKRKVAKHRDQPASIEDILNSDFELDAAKKEQLGKEILESDIYNLNLPERNNFEAWSHAQGVYDKLNTAENAGLSEDPKKSLDLSTHSTGWETKTGYKDTATYLDALAELILKEREEMADLERQINRGRKENQWGASLVGLLNYKKERLEQIAWHIWGVAEAAKRSNDATIHEKAAKLASGVCPEQKRDEFLSRRLGENGKFKLVKEDLARMVSST